MENQLTRSNINDFLLNYVGLDEDEVILMPLYAKKDIVEGMLDEFEEFINEQ